MKGVGILPGNRPQYIDHLVPLCQLLQIPLLVTDPWIAELIRTYYPPMEILFADPPDFVLDEALEEYDTFVYVEFSRKGHGSFQFHEYVCRKKARSIMSLHGNPDKFWDVYWLEHLADEDIVLVYGQQLKKLLEEKGIQKKVLLSGNYRLNFYREHQDFFDLGVPFFKEKPTVLYAPTWVCKDRTSELKMNYSPFFDVYSSLFNSLSEKYQLIVKLHPLLVTKHVDEIEEIKETYPDVLFLNDFPPIYPLLNQIDIYLGDYSSIGYDFLCFKRPLFFLGVQAKTALHSVGRVIEIKDLPYLDAFEVERGQPELYHEVFSEKKIEVLKQEIEDACRSHSY